MRLAVAGEGAFGVRHLEALGRIADAEVVWLAGGEPATTEAAARRFGIPRWTCDLADCLGRAEVDAVILATPTPLHARQAIQCLEAGKPVQVEIPMADSLEDAQRLVDVAEGAGLVAMAGHTRRFNPSHRWLHRRLRAGELTMFQLVVQTFFLRRANINALGQSRSWTDHLLWHHAAHTVDLFHHQTGETCSLARAVQGPPHPVLGIAMDMAVQLKTPSGAVCNLSLSFNNDGPLGSEFRYVCDERTYIARYDDLVDGWGVRVDVADGSPAMDGVELQDREFIAAIAEGRRPEASVANVLPAYRVLYRLQRDLAAQAVPAQAVSGVG